jgi:4-amino-4-deoxy-L-arabinose transferase-like glycosyltransferase
MGIFMPIQERESITACRSSQTVSVLAAVFAAVACLGALRYIGRFLGELPLTLAFIVFAGVFSWATARWPRRVFQYCILIGLVAFGLRLAWILTTSFPPLSDDYEHYRSVSLDMMQGKYGELLITFWPWGYFLYLAFLGRIFGSALMVPLTANAVLGTATVLLVYAVARHLLGERNGRVAAGLYACFPGVIYWHSVLCTEIPHLFLFLSALACLVKGLETRPRRQFWLAGGGVLAALAEFVRAISPFLLIPFAWFAYCRSVGSRRWSVAGIALGAYVACMAVLLGAQSIASGYPTYSTSKTLGMNLAFGLNRDTGGTFYFEDALAMYRNDPRETNRLGMETAKRRLGELLRSGWQAIPELAVRKFFRMWSEEDTGIGTVLDAVPAGLVDTFWLSRHEGKFHAAAHCFHLAVLLMASVGFWRKRSSGELAIPAGTFLALIALHTVIEVDSRYHFAAQALLGIAAAAALRPASANRTAAELSDGQ